MKKLLLALATISTLSLASCETADISPMNINGNRVGDSAIENLETEGIELEKPEYVVVKKNTNNDLTFQTLKANK